MLFVDDNIDVSGISGGDSAMEKSLLPLEIKPVHVIVMLIAAAHALAVVVWIFLYVSESA